MASTHQPDAHGKCGQRDSALYSEHAALTLALPAPDNGVWPSRPHPGVEPGQPGCTTC